jgi:2'-5' RNA ligase
MLRPYKQTRRQSMTDHLSLETAILLPVPPSVLEIAYSLAKQYAPKMVELYPLHFTLLWPFVPMDQLEAGCQRLRDLAVTLHPVPVTLGGYGDLGRALYLNPVDPAPLVDLFRAVYDAFPDCPPYYGRHGGAIHPHVTVGLFKKPTDRAEAMLPDYPPISFTIDRLHVFYGPQRERLPWVVHDVIPIG